jgi:hypothetical protein
MASIAIRVVPYLNDVAEITGCILYAMCVLFGVFVTLGLIILAITYLLKCCCCCRCDDD